MNLQELEYTRIELRRALADFSGSTKGQLQAFSEHPPADKNKYPRHHPEIVMEGGECCGAKVVKTLATPLYVLETRSRRRPLPPMKDAEFASSAWRRSVNGLGEHLQAWVRYCYGYDLSFRYQTLMCQYVWAQFQHQQGSKKLQDRVTKKLVGLVWLAAQEVAASRNNDTYQEYAGAALARMVSVERSTWLRVYAAHWAAFKAAFVEMDSLALCESLARYEEYEEVKVVEM
ncbi:TPA: antitermination protein [Escherichia coli]|uniref:bacteriophage antitermination protein Q n=1 Tax=Enterobacteriaceae TaxID=543 RepID=UPI00076F214B|nr:MULTISPECIES: bacteriophage antitermination protein Q [Enterobacteriaceae]EGF2691777.1 antitermination protein [Shigella sonnei]HAS0832094.1 antitermination protein [Enterobacter cloacae subsp. cloacae]EEZ5380697.1 antitermination protein [Escherichia coli]EFE0688475.1 antitermination protein [Escherichia coli]EFH4790070.1 antitermination protein [Escherichia coli]